MGTYPEPVAKHPEYGGRRSTMSNSCDAIRFLSHLLVKSAKTRLCFLRREFETVRTIDLYSAIYRRGLRIGKSQISGGYCWPCMDPPPMSRRNHPWNVS